jgi:hypothetical protein
VGAPKAGTTSVDRLLRNHPDVFLSPIKEPCHFCPDVREQLVQKWASRKPLDLEAYLASSQREVVHMHPVSRAEDYARLFSGAGGLPVVGECSTFYLSSGVAAAEIHAYNPDARIVVMVRKPIDRIRSHYAMDRSLGLATRPLLSLVKEELALGDQANWGNCRYYIGASRYQQQIEAFNRFFPRERVCVLSFESLVAEPDRTLRRLFDFLGLDAPAEPLALPRENASRAARFPWLHSGLRQFKPIIAGLLKDTSSSRIGTMAKSVYYREKATIVPEDDLAELATLLQAHGLEPFVALAA